MTVALRGASGASEIGVTESEVIFPLMRIRQVCQNGRFESYVPEAKEIPYLLLACLVTDIPNLIDVVSVALERKSQTANDLRERRVKTCSERFRIEWKAYLLRIPW